MNKHKFSNKVRDKRCPPNKKTVGAIGNRLVYKGVPKEIRKWRKKKLKFGGKSPPPKIERSRLFDPPK